MPDNKESSFILLIAVLFGGSLFAGSPNQIEGNFDMPTNLTPIPTGWQKANTGMDLSVGGTLGSNITFDSGNQHGGADSIKIDAGNLTLNPARECNGPYIAIKPGDQITFSVYMKTSASTLGDVLKGARCGVDWYGANGAISGTSSPDGAPAYTIAGGWCATDTYVHWGNDWTQITISFTVAATYEHAESVVSNPNYSNGENVVPTGMIPWLQVQASADGGVGWFGSPSLTITPLDETPLVEPSFSVFSVSDGSVLRDEPVTCNVTVTGAGATPTGTVTFHTSNTTAGTWQQLGLPVTLDAGGSATSIMFYPSMAGTYLFRVEYSGDTVYTDYSSTDSLLSVSNPIEVASPTMLGTLGSILTQMENF